MPDFNAPGKPFKLVLVAILLVCVCLAVLVFISSSNEISLAIILANPLLIPALLLQIIASGLFVTAWKVLLGVQSKAVFTFRECTAQIGVTLLGKYLPGKIWGLLGRSYLLTRRQLSGSDAMSLLITDQFITFYTGIVIGVIALFAYYFPALAVAIALLAAITVPAASKRYDHIIGWLLAHGSALIRKLSPNLATGTIRIHQRQFMLSFLSYCLYWVSTAAVLCLLFYPAISAELWLNCSLIVAAIPLAVMSGFLAIWAPGGIGVREAVMVAILSLQLPLESAAAIAISYRLICILTDLVIGGFAFLYYSRNAPTSLRED